MRLKPTTVILTLVSAVVVTWALFDTFGTPMRQAQANQALVHSKQAQTPVLSGTYKALRDDSPVDLTTFQGDVVLVVNTASKCGYTGQYEALEALHDQYKSKGLTILGFPSTSFKQEFKDDQQIADFCKNTYAIEFPMFSQVEVVGPNAAPLFQTLAKATGKPVSWNFNKYLISRDGNTVWHFSSNMQPKNSPLENLIQQELAKPKP